MPVSKPIAQNSPSIIVHGQELTCRYRTNLTVEVSRLDYPAREVRGFAHHLSLVGVLAKWIKRETHWNSDSFGGSQSRSILRIRGIGL